MQKTKPILLFTNGDSKQRLFLIETDLLKKNNWKKYKCDSFRKKQPSPEHQDDKELKKKEKQRLEKEKKEQKEKDKKRNEMHKKFKVNSDT